MSRLVRWRNLGNLVVEAPSFLMPLSPSESNTNGGRTRLSHRPFREQWGKAAEVNICSFVSLLCLAPMGFAQPGCGIASAHRDTGIDN